MPDHKMEYLRLDYEDMRLNRERNPYFGTHYLDILSDEIDSLKSKIRTKEFDSVNHEIALEAMLTDAMAKVAEIHEMRAVVSGE